MLAASILGAVSRTRSCGILITPGWGRLSGATSKEASLLDLTADIGRRLPPAFDMEAAQLRFPVDASQSMNTVLCQELERYNRLINVIRGSLDSLTLALQGQVPHQYQFQR
jgi:dynein heavy chain, axonemal